MRELAQAQRRWQVSTAGGAGPVWARDGSELFYRHGRRMMAVKVAHAAEFAASRPEVLFEGRYAAASAAGRPNYDVGPDGRFVMVVEDDDRSRPSSLVLVQNWFEELHQKISAKR